MARRLPPLNALRAFEAAGRHLSISRAAEELNVTPAAVSQQVKALEEYLEVALFRRFNKALLLTDAGQACLPGLRGGFDLLTEAVKHVATLEARRPLTVSVTASFGGKWLVPRLDRFRELHPSIDVRIDATARLVDFSREDVDVAIRYGPGRERGLRIDRLMGEEIFPVCSPELLVGNFPLNSPESLCHYTLLHVDSATLDETWPDWQMWLLTAGVGGIDVSRGPRFTRPSMAVQAATEAHGVALGSSVLVADDLAEGRLVKPFDVSFPVNFAYHVVCRKRWHGNPR